MNKQLYKHWWSLSKTATLNTEVLRWKEGVRGRESEGAEMCGGFCGGNTFAGGHDGDRKRRFTRDLKSRSEPD